MEGLNVYLEKSSYLSGEAPTQVDRVVFEALQCPPAPAKVHLARWYKHVASFSAEQRNAFTGITCDVSGISVGLSPQVSNGFNKKICFCAAPPFVVSFEKTRKCTYKRTAK